MSSYPGRLSLGTLPKGTSLLFLHQTENGPSGIRTRICDLNGVLCSHHTTGPKRKFPRRFRGKVKGYNLARMCRIGRRRGRQQFTAHVKVSHPMSVVKITISNPKAAGVANAPSAELFHSEHFVRRDHCIAVNRHCVFHSRRVASGKRDAHRNIPRFRHPEHEFIPSLQPFPR
jgi:hypothetical protein